MRRTYHRIVSTNAEPSVVKWDEDQPRDCARCGVRLRISRKDSIIMRRYPVRESFCARCFT